MHRRNARHTSKKLLTLAALCLALSAFPRALSAENFRIRQTHVIDFAQSQGAQSRQLAYNDVLAITLPKDRQFMQGVELEFKIPQELLTYKHCIGFSFYEEVSPPPAKETIDYSGKRIYINSLPASLSMVLQIPLSERHSIEETPYTTQLPHTIIEGGNSVFLRLLPIMKGLPENLDELVFEITAKPLFTDEGILNLEIVYPSSSRKEIAVFIDEKPVNGPPQQIHLPAGMHYLAITSENYRTEVRTFSIEQTKTTSLSVKLRDTAPSVLITAPDNTQVFLDGERIVWNNGAIAVQQGEHTFKFVVGDYEVTKTISAINGKTYNVSLTVDVQLSETP